MDTFNDVLDGIGDIPFIAQNTEQLPRLGWRNGNKQAKTAGFWYIKADAVGSATHGDWKRESVYDDEDGYVVATARIAYLLKRNQAFIMDDSGTYPQRRWLDQWQKGASIQTEILCLVDGFGDQLFILSAKGLAGKELTSRGGIFDQHQRLIQAINKISQRTPLNPWALWCPITGQTANGKPIYYDTGYKSTVTLPAFVDYDPNTIAKTLKERFVGRELYAAATELYQQYHAEGWHTTKRGNVPTEPEPASFTPQPSVTSDGYDDDSLPF